MNIQVRNMVSNNTNREIPNQFIIKTDKGTFFQSYSSVIAKIAHGELTISANWEYSNTTRKYLYAFLGEYGFGSLCNAESMRNAIKNKRVKYRNVSSLKF